MNSNSYMYPLSGSGGNATESIRRNMMKENIINHASIMDFPELITQLDNMGLVYENNDTEILPSGSSLMITVNNQSLHNVSIPLYEYMIGQSERLSEERYYTLSYYYNVENPGMLDLRIQLSGCEIVTDTEEVIDAQYSRRIIVFRKMKNSYLSELLLEISAMSTNPYVPTRFKLSSMKLEYGDTVTGWVPVKSVKNVIKISKLHNEGITLYDVQPNSDIVVIHTSEISELRRIEVVFDCELKTTSPSYFFDELYVKSVVGGEVEIRCTKM